MYAISIQRDGEQNWLTEHENNKLKFGDISNRKLYVAEKSARKMFEQVAQVYDGAKLHII